MNAQAIINYAVQANILMSVENGNLVIDAPKGQISEEFRECLIKNKSELLEALTYYGYTIDELKQKLGIDYEEFKDNQAALIAFAEILYEQKLMSSEQVPPRFTATTFCVSCNAEVKLPPALASSPKIDGCCWCHIRKKSIQH